MSKPSPTTDPIGEQEELYRLPYHWFPEERLKRFERQEKQRILCELLGAHAPQPVRRYLDVGCGDGRWTADLKTRLEPATEVVGVDFSARAIGFAKLIEPSIDFQVQRGETLPFADRSFDLISAIEVIEHVEDGAEEPFLAELYRLLDPRGLLLLTTPSLRLKLARHHFRHYSVARLGGLLAAAGFSVRAWRGQSNPCYGRRRWLRKRMNLFPVIWKLWRFTYRETQPERSLNLMVAARPASRENVR